MTHHVGAQPTESEPLRLRWYLGAVAVLVAVIVVGSVAAAATGVNTGDGVLIAVSITVSAAILVRLALAAVVGRLRPIVPLAFLLGLLANIALLASYLRYGYGGDETGSEALFFPITLAHLTTVIAYGVVAALVYRQQARNAATTGLLFAVAYVGVVLTFTHILFV